MGKEKKKGNCLTMLDQILLKLSQFVQAFFVDDGGTFCKLELQRGGFLTFVLEQKQIFRSCQESDGL